VGLSEKARFRSSRETWERCGADLREQSAEIIFKHYRELVTEEAVLIPEYAYDAHAREGETRGETKADFFKAEQTALQPFQPGLFDHLIDE
jgi:hypothetical protein